jgi:hypothetical protein
MNNDQTISLIKGLGKMGFTVVEVRQQQLDGSPVDQREATGIITVRLVPRRQHFADGNDGAGEQESNQREIAEMIETELREAPALC